MRTLKIRNWEVPVVLFWVSLFAFGILIPWLGFYADDWPYLFTVKAFGPQGLNDFISWVRPFSAWVLEASAWSIAAIFTGIFSLLVARWPIRIPQIPVNLIFAWDLATLPFIVGVSFVVAGMVNLIPGSQLQVVFLGVLIAFSAGLMFQIHQIA